MKKMTLKLPLKILTAGFLLFQLGSCRDGIVLNQPVTFPDKLVTPEPVIASPSKVPETTVEIVQMKIIESKKYLPYLPPIAIALFVFFVFYHLLRLIYELTTSSPES